MNRDDILFLTVAEAADVLRVSEKTIRRLLDREEIPATMIKGAVRIYFASLIRWALLNGNAAQKKLDATEAPL